MFIVDVLINCLFLLIICIVVKCPNLLYVL